MSDDHPQGEEKAPLPKKHPCRDCSFCQWCSDDRCNLCLGTNGCCGKKKLSVQEQIALYESMNRQGTHEGEDG